MKPRTKLSYEQLIKELDANTKKTLDVMLRDKLYITIVKDLDVDLSNAQPPLSDTSKDKLHTKLKGAIQKIPDKMLVKKSVDEAYDLVLNELGNLNELDSERKKNLFVNIHKWLDGLPNESGKNEVYRKIKKELNVKLTMGLKKELIKKLYESLFDERSKAELLRQLEPDLKDITKKNLMNILEEPTPSLGKPTGEDSGDPPENQSDPEISEINLNLIKK